MLQSAVSQRARGSARTVIDTVRFPVRTARPCGCGGGSSSKLFRLGEFNHVRVANGSFREDQLENTTLGLIQLRLQLPAISKNQAR